MKFKIIFLMALNLAPTVLQATEFEASCEDGTKRLDVIWTEYNDSVVIEGETFRLLGITETDVALTSEVDGRHVVLVFKDDKVILDGVVLDQFMNCTLNIISLAPSTFERTAYVTEEQLNRATDYFAVGDRNRAFAIWLRAAEQGIPRGMHNMGYLYEMGIVVAQDFDMAFHWYNRAAELEFTPSQMEVARLYRTGTGAPEDLAKSLSWYLRVANSRHVELQKVAQFFVGEYYRRGLGVEVDLALARQWFERSAALGFQNAADTLEGMNQ